MALWGMILIGILIVSFLLSMFLYLIGRERHNSSNKKIRAIINASPYNRYNTPPPLALNDPLARDKVYEKRQAERMELGVVKYNPDGEMQEMDEGPQIVGIAEPKGFWTKFIMAQKMGYIKMRMSLNTPGSFWTTLIKAQSAQQGKSQGRGR